MISTRSAVALAVACATGVSALAAGPQNRERSFDREPVNEAPAGFSFAAMRQPEPGVWLVRRDGTNGILAHPAVAGSRGFAMAIADGTPLTDVAVSVKLRTSGGRRTAGIISRYQDPRNYYLTVLDLEDRELRMFRVFEGNLNRIELKRELELDPDSWHTLKVVHREHVVYALLGGIRVFEDRNNVNAAFPAGRCGLMATGDTEAWFDDFAVEPIRPHTERE